MDDSKQTGIDQGGLDALSVAPPPTEDAGNPDADMTRVREGHDAANVKGLRSDPSDESAKLDVALDETFPNSDAPSNTQPGKGKDPAPSSGYDPASEPR